MNYRKIIITGPECSGKSTLGKYLSKELGFDYLTESSVKYLNDAKRPYEFSDLKKIAQLQNQLEIDAMNHSESTIICDTSFLVLYIWSYVRFGKVGPFIMKGLGERQNDLYLLCKPDLNWEPGPYRENPQNRIELFNLYLKWLTENEYEFFVVQGRGEIRYSLVRLIVKSKLSL